MLKNRTIAAITAAVLMTATAIPPVYAQDSYQRQLDDYQRQRDQYERDRADYDRNYGQPPAPSYADRDDRYQSAQDNRDCQQRRTGNQVGGFIVGAIAGGLLGSTIARGPARGGGTALGAILGGAVGAGIGGNSISCDDQQQVYRTYYDGFERGRPGAHYSWNTRNNVRGDFVVDRYYRDRRGMRCATYTQTIYVQGRPRTATGEACRGRDGNWEIIS